MIGEHQLQVGEVQRRALFDPDTNFLVFLPEEGATWALSDRLYGATVTEELEDSVRVTLHYALWGYQLKTQNVNLNPKLGWLERLFLTGVPMRPAFQMMRPSGERRFRPNKYNVKEIERAKVRESLQFGHFATAYEVPNEVPL